MLKGERVVLRAVEREDLAQLWEFANDLDLQALVSDRAPAPVSRAELEALFDRRAKEEQPDAARFVIDVGGRVIGFCDLFRFDDYARTCRLGIYLGDPEYRGTGIGSESIRLLLEYAFVQRNVRKVCLNVLADNEQAIRTYEACGFVEEGRLRQQEWSAGDYHDDVHMGILRQEWLRSRSG